MIVSGIVEIALGADGKRLARIFFQPVLAIWALGATGAWQAHRAGTWPSATERSRH